MTRPRSSVAPLTPARLPFLLLAALAAAVIALPTTGAAATTQAWRASVGASGANGVATLAATGSTANLKLALKALTASTAYPVRLTRGTCVAPGPTLWVAPTQTSTATGKIAKSLAIPAAKLAAIRAGAAAGPIAIRVGSGSKLRCGVFALVGPVATPTPAPTPTSEPSLAATIGVSAEVGSGVGGIAADTTSVWAVDLWKPLAYRLDPATGSAAASADFTASRQLPVAGAVNAAAALGFGSLWVQTVDFSKQVAPDTYTGNGAVLRIDTNALSVSAKITSDGDIWSVAVGDGSVWATQYAPNALLRIDPATNTVAKTVPLPEGPREVAVGSGAAWVIADTSLLRVDLATFAVTSLDLGSDTDGVAVSDSAVWVAVDAVGSGSARLLRVSPATFSIVTSIDVPGSPSGVAVGGGYVWVAPGDKTTPTAIAVSEASNKVVASVPLPKAFVHVAIRGRAAWFASESVGDPTVARVDY